MKRLYSTAPLVLLTILIACALTACVGTREAYRAADTPEKRAYTVAEHYSALVKEAADLKDAGALTGSALADVQAADRTAKPLVIGDPSSTPPKAGLKQLAKAYTDVRSAENEIALQAALNRAVLAVNDFIQALKGARR